MRGEQIAREYARGLFEAAVGKKNLDKVVKEVNFVGDNLTDPEFEGFFQSIKIDSEAKKSVFNKVFLQEVSVITRNFFWLIFDNGRENLLYEIRNEFERLVDEQNKCVVAKVITAVPLNDKIKRRLQKQLTDATKKEVLVETVVDPSIFGGMLVYADGQVIDASVKSRLNNLRERLTQAR
ncbi:MAG TPA: ATP synthase F1 subunit delta [Candidatus Aquicultor sp.]|jgi:F-type H+-transporting ATPase subunit delta